MRRVALVDDGRVWFCGVATRVIVSATSVEGVLRVAPEELCRLGASAVDGKRALQLLELHVGDCAMLVLWAHHPELARDDGLLVAEAARSQLGLPLIVVVGASAGRLSVDLSFCDADENERDAALMAAAVSQARDGCVESEKIQLSLDGGAACVVPYYADGRWHARIGAR